MFIVLKWRSEYTDVSKEGVIKHSGIFFKREQKFACNFVEAIKIEQSLLGILFNYGTLELYDPALEEKIYLLNISSPKKNRDLIEKLVSKESDKPMPFVAKDKQP